MTGPTKSQRRAPDTVRPSTKTATRGREPEHVDEGRHPDERPVVDARHHRRAPPARRRTRPAAGRATPPPARPTCSVAQRRARSEDDEDRRWRRSGASRRSAAGVGRYRPVQSHGAAPRWPPISPSRTSGHPGGAVAPLDIPFKLGEPRPGSPLPLAFWGTPGRAVAPLVIPFAVRVPTWLASSPVIPFAGGASTRLPSSPGVSGRPGEAVALLVIPFAGEPRPGSRFSSLAPRRQPGCRIFVTKSL